jgi:type II secretory pathway component GspD/PulD (secretin)/tetratricopeptide (TPR) repeat protein
MDSMASRKIARKWAHVALGLALFPVASSWEGRLAAQPPAPFAAVRESEPAGKEAEARELLRVARQALKAGDMARAEQYARRAQSIGVAGALWDKDCPENVLADVAVARAKAIPDADPKTLLKLSRDAMAAGKFDDAQALANKATQSNFNWGMFGDNPTKCIDEIQKARAKSEKAESMKMMGEARRLFDQGKLDEAESLAYRAERLHGAYGVMDMGDKPQKLLGDIQTARAKAKKNGTAIVKTASKPDAAPADIQQVSAAAPIPANKQRAIKMIVDGKAAMQNGRYVEARNKFLEAQKTCNEFKPDEDNPVRCLNDLTAMVMKQASDAAAGSLTPERTMAVRNVAADFGLDVKAIDSRLNLKKAGGTDVVGVGQTLLEKARIEMQRGQTDVARQLATEAFNGPYNCQAEAAGVMRSIDAIEESAKTAAAMKAFDAAVVACQTKDFVQALAIFRQIDQAVLPVEHKTKIGDMMQTCQQQVDALANVPAIEAPALTPPPIMSDAAAAPIAAPTAPASGERLADQVKALQRVEFQRMREEGQKVQTESKKMFERGETNAALNMLQTYLDKVKSSQLDPVDAALLCKPVDQRLATLSLLKSQKDSETGINSKKINHDAERGRTAIADAKKQEQIKDLIKQYDQYLKEGKMREAALCAAKAKELNPDDPALAALDKTAQTKYNLNSYESAKDNKEKMFVGGLNQAENPGPYVDTDRPLAIDRVVMETAKNRSKGIDNLERMKTETEKEIQHKMSSVVDMNFSNAPLRQVIDDLRVMTGINFIADISALEEERVSLDTPVNIRLDKIKLSSGLKVMLDQVHLTSVIADDVLKITTPRKARGTLVQRVYRVADLVMPIEDYKQPESMNLERAMQRHIEQQGMSGIGGGQSPTNNGKFMLNGGQPVSSSGSSNPSMSNSPSAVTGMSQIGAPTTTKQTLHEMIIRMVQNTVAPTTWAEAGGSGTIDYMPIGMALVINQTVDVQEQVAGLLDALRRLQDLQIAIEIKLITLSETFFERIGLDFNLNVKTDHVTGKYEPQLTTGQFKPAGQVNDFSPNRFIAGLNPAGSQGSPGSFTSDLDIPIKSSSFQYGIPPFAYPNNPGFDGGLSLGLAFLSDIQVYMFMEAAQGDRRIHVMQAPKLTLFNGQSSSISVQDQQFFVTNVGIVGFGGQVVFVPQNNPFPLGVEMTLQAVCSADRRYVRINTNVRLANLASALVPLFPVTTFITPVFEGGAQGQPIPFTQFIQQPALSLVNIQTTVSIPDGGTVILGGLKTLSEGRNEFGPPVLSKIPYVNRLFRNSGFGREAQSLLVMVTPRIIINAEEEERQAGISTREEQ